MNNGHPFDKRSARVSPLDSLKGRTGQKDKERYRGFREREREKERERAENEEEKKRRKIEVERKKKRWWNYLSRERSKLNKR